MVNSSGGKSEKVLPAGSGIGSDYPPMRYQNLIPVMICMDSDFSYTQEQAIEFVGDWQDKDAGLPAPASSKVKAYSR
jgi:hypothetical protein